MGSIFLVSSRPAGQLPPIAFNDKVAHAVVYGILAYCILRAISPPPASTCRARAVAITLVWVALYGASDEWHQGFVEGREVSSADWLADVVGGLVALGIMRWLRRRKGHG
jgi:VanZ family protein